LCSWTALIAHPQTRFKSYIRRPLVFKLLSSASQFNTTQFSIVS
jgi:hypothetical protein